MKVLILGKNSQVGKSFIKKNNFIFLSKKQADITNFLKLKKKIFSISPDIIINLVAYNNVPKSENDYANALKINFGGVKNLLKIIKNKNIFLIHISTDYVFSGKKNINKAWKVNSKRNPLNKYGLSKKKAEDEILKSRIKNVLIVRTSWVFSEYNENFVKKILHLSKNLDQIEVVSDQYGAPTSARSLAKFLVYLTSNLKKVRGCKVIHYCNKPYCSWFDFAKKIIKNSEMNIQVIPIKTKKNNIKLQRPKNTKLDYEFTKNKLFYRQESWEKYLKRICV